VDRRRPSLVLLDVWLHGSPMDGLEVLEAIKAREPDLPVIIFSGHGNIDTAVAAIGRGALDFIEKPFETERLLHLVERATETERLRRENARLKLDTVQGTEFHGSSSAINHVRATLKRVANTGSRLLISGPSGAGKEVAARLLHSWSGPDHARTVRGRTVWRGGQWQAGARWPARTGRWRHALSR
jgi:two-component system nitrogen regulation response regulator NtrX